MKSTIAYSVLGSALASQVDYMDFTQGMLMGSLDLDASYFINPKWKVCFYDAENVLLDVVTGVRDLTSLDMQGVINFVNSIGAAFWAITDVVEDCNPLKEAILESQGGAVYGSGEQDFAMQALTQEI